jgi:hypothetical protein
MLYNNKWTGVHYFGAVTVVIFPWNLLFRKRLAREIVLQDELNICFYFLDTELEEIINGMVIAQLQDVIDLVHGVVPECIEISAVVGIEGKQERSLFISSVGIV